MQNSLELLKKSISDADSELSTLELRIKELRTQQEKDRKELHEKTFAFACEHTNEILIPWFRQWESVYEQIREHANIRNMCQLLTATRSQKYRKEELPVLDRFFFFLVRETDDVVKNFCLRYLDFCWIAAAHAFLSKKLDADDMEYVCTQIPSKIHNRTHPLGGAFPFSTATNYFMSLQEQLKPMEMSLMISIFRA